MHSSNMRSYIFLRSTCVEAAALRKPGRCLTRSEDNLLLPSFLMLFLCLGRFYLYTLCL